MFYEGDISSGIALATHESKSVVCFIRDESENSLTWENDLLKEEILAQSLRNTSVVLRLEAGSQEAEALSAFCPIRGAPTLVVIKNGAVQESLNSGDDSESVKRRLIIAVGGLPEQSPQRDTSTISPVAGPSTEDDPSSRSVSGEPAASDTSQDDGFTPPDDASQDRSNSTVEDQVPGNQELPVDDDGEDEEVENAVTSQSPDSQEQENEENDDEKDEDEDEEDRPGPSRAVPSSRVTLHDYLIHLRSLEEQNRARLIQAQREHYEETGHANLEECELHLMELEKRNKARLLSSRGETQQEEQEEDSSPAALNLENAPTSNPKSKECAILIRLTDGSTLRSRSPLNATINEEIRPFIDTHRTDIPTSIPTTSASITTATTTRKTSYPYTIKHLLTPHPNRIFTESEEESSSLEDLGLFPSATLVITNVTRGSHAYDTPPGNEGVISRMFSTGLNTVKWFVGWVWMVIRVFLDIGGRAEREGAGNSAGKNEQGISSSSGSAAEARNKASTSAMRSRGIRITTLQDQREREERERQQLEGAEKDDGDGSKEGKRRQFYNGNQGSSAIMPTRLPAHRLLDPTMLEDLRKMRLAKFLLDYSDYLTFNLDQLRTDQKFHAMAWNKNFWSWAEILKVVENPNLTTNLAASAEMKMQLQAAAIELGGTYEHLLWEIKMYAGRCQRAIESLSVNSSSK
ncbi:MAG: hypothetical protein M1823_002818 [Watsoniomyces obsoletus]|nr:MAG: hypothetical protein M1823_002818 [Watsoniomyces obsoletus]